MIKSTNVNTEAFGQATGISVHFLVVGGINWAKGYSPWYFYFFISLNKTPEQNEEIQFSGPSVCRVY